MVESSSGAVADLRVDLARAGLSHVQVSEGHVDRMLESRARDGVDLVLLDPPRAGLSESASAALIEIAAPRVVYLSCDPATLARDTARLGAGGYALESVEGFDLFPQTAHLEALVVLTRQGGDQGWLPLALIRYLDALREAPAVRRDGLVDGTTIGNSGLN